MEHFIKFIGGMISSCIAGWIIGGPMIGSAGMFIYLAVAAIFDRE